MLRNARIETIPFSAPLYTSRVSRLAFPLDASGRVPSPRSSLQSRVSILNISHSSFLKTPKSGSSRLENMSSPASSRRRASSKRGSVSSTPVRSQASRATPRQPPAQAIPSSSPLFYRSSPVDPNSQRAGNTNSDALAPSSPVRFSFDAPAEEGTPRAGQPAAIRGMRSAGIKP